MNQNPNTNIKAIGTPNGEPWFGRTYSIKFYAKDNSLLHEIYSDNRNAWSGLRINFNITQLMYFINQEAVIQIYNVSDATKRLISKSARVILSAGYQLSVATLYEGNVMNVFDNRVQPDYILTFICLDYMPQYKPIDITIPAGTTPINALKMAASQVEDLKINDVNFKNLPTTPTDQKITIPHMEYSQALEKLGDQLGIDVWVLNGNLYAIANKLTDYPGNSETVIVDFRNGMVGSPFFNLANTGIDVTSLLNPRLIPGNMIQVKTLNPEVQISTATYVGFDQNSLTRGKWIIQSANHTGDSFDGVWQTFIEAYTFAPLAVNLI